VPENKSCLHLEILHKQGHERLQGVSQRVGGDDPSGRRRCPSTIVGPGSDGQYRAGRSSKQLIGKAAV
jgi:hypothetical protein